MLPASPVFPFSSVTPGVARPGKHVNVVLLWGGLVDLEFGDNRADLETL